ncbi:MAG: hypothetical protein LBK77_09315 [Spirochaetaceae bacterium]|jgi:hypothetical protein|nr:hypothetical protein [Spirochaetaceae bacterium]
MKPAVLFMAVLLPALASCAKPELRVWSELWPDYPELSGLFTEAAETYKKLSVRCFDLPRNKEYAEAGNGIFILDGNSLPAFLEAGLALDTAAHGGIHAHAQIRPAYGPGGQRAFFLYSGNGVLCYDPELTRRYLEIADPLPVQEQLGDLNSFIVSAFLISERSRGAVAALPEADQLLPSFRHTKASSLQKAGLSPEETEKWFADIAEIFRDRRWEGTSFEDGRPRPAAMFFLPPGSFFREPGKPAGNWRAIRGPDPESSGGIWLVLHRDLFGGKKRAVQKYREYLDIFVQVLEAREALPEPGGSTAGD